MTDAEGTMTQGFQPSRRYAARMAFSDQWVGFLLMICLFALAMIVLPFFGVNPESNSRTDEPWWVPVYVGSIMLVGGAVGFVVIFRATYRLIMRGVVVSAMVVSDESPMGKPLFGKSKPIRGVRRTYSYAFQGRTYEGYFSFGVEHFAPNLHDLSQIRAEHDWTGREIEILVDPKRPSVSQVIGG